MFSPRENNERTTVYHDHVICVNIASSQQYNNNPLAEQVKRIRTNCVRHHSVSCASAIAATASTEKLFYKIPETLSWHDKRHNWSNYRDDAIDFVYVLIILLLSSLASTAIFRWKAISLVLCRWCRRWTRESMFIRQISGNATQWHNRIEWESCVCVDDDGGAL